MAFQDAIGVVVCCFVLLLISVTNGQEPTWIKQPTDQNVTIGNDALIHCEVNNRGSLQTSWSVASPAFNGVLFVNNGAMGTNPRYSIEGEYNLKISPTTAADTGTYKCQVGAKLAGSALLNIFVAPGSPAISVPPNLKEGTDVQLKCATSNGNPTPTIKWFRNGVELLSTTEKNGAVTTGTLMRKLTYEDHNAKFVCQVFNDVNKDKPLEKEEILKVQFKPRVSFRPYNPLVAVEGASDYIECVVAANPSETSVSWSKGGTDKGSNHNLTFASVTKADAGEYTCSATNSIGKGSAKINMQVHYPPIVSLPNAVETYAENEKVSIKCSVDSKPSPTKVAWYDLTTGRNVHIGRTLDFPKIGRKEAGKYSCNATNELKPSGQSPIMETGSAVVEVLVQYAPGPASIAEVGQVKTGDKTTLTCTVQDKGLPPAQFRWKLKDGTETNNTGTYIIANTKLSDDGVYTCVPFNSVGPGRSAAITLQVFEPPKFLKEVPQQHQADEGTQNFMLNCQVRGKPAPKIVWYKDGKDLSRERDLYSTSMSQSDIGGSKKSSSNLEFKGRGRPDGNKLIVSDAGNYTCKAWNDISSVSSWGVLIIKYQPRMEIQSKKIGANVNTKVVMTCACNAEPKPRFEWYFGQSKLTNGGDVSIAPGSPRPGFKYVSKLTVKTLTQAGYGIYYCKVMNGFAKGNQTEFIVTKKSAPEKPSDLRVQASTWDSVNLKWEPGFDGGMPQRFVIQYDGKEKETATNTFNVTGLYPNRTYTFTVLGMNSLGRGSPSDSVTATTESLYIAKPLKVKFNKQDNIVHYTASGSNYCVKVDISTDGVKWVNYQKCAPVQDAIKIEKADFVVNHVNLTLCLRKRQDICGEPPVKAKTVESEDTVPTETIIIVASVCGAVVLILLVVLLVVCCRRQKKDKEFPEAAHRRPNPVPVTGSKRGRRPPSGIDNPALDTLDGDLDDPTMGDNQAVPRMNGGPPNLYAHQNGRLPVHVPNDPPPSYELASFKDPFSITITHPEGYESLEEKPPLQLNSDSSDRPYLDLHPNGSIKMDDSRSHNESGYSTPDPTKPKKVIYEVIV